MTALQDRLDQGDILILDGGVGTEIQRRQVPMDDGAWSATANRTHPDDVRAVHADFIAAGADIIIANTFAAGRHVLEPCGLAGEIAALNQRAVGLAQEARDAAAAGHGVAIAGSISSMYTALDPVNIPTPAQARASFREQAAILAEAGVDLLLLEMMMEPEQSISAVEEAAATGLPVWVGFSCRRDDSGRVVMFSKREPAIPFEVVIDAAMAAGGSVAAVMHSDVVDTLPAIDVLRARWSGPVAAYAESGTFTMPNWQFSGIVSPEDYAEAALSWVDHGVQIIGGCCGIGPDHIRRLRAQLPARLSES